MEIVLYRNRGVAKDFEDAFRTSFPQLMSYSSIPSFCTRLRHMLSQSVIIVLAAASEREMTTFMSIRHLIEDAPTILVLPTGNAALLAKAHQLHPRFIGDLGSSANEVIAVVKKMLTRNFDQ